MKPAENLWVASDSDECWACVPAYETREEASENAREDHDLMPDQDYFTGQLKRLSIDSLRLFDSDWILDDIEEKAGEEWGDDAVDGFLGKKVTGQMGVELEKMLQQAFMRWIKKHDLDLKYWQIDGVLRHEGEGDGTVATSYIGAAGTGPIDVKDDDRRAPDPGEVEP